MASSREPQRSQEGPALQISLERDSKAPSLARAAVAGFTEESEMANASLATLALLVSELVSNAVVHSDAPPASRIVLRACLLGHRAVRVEVTDWGSGFTTMPRDPTQEKCGYGLYLVDMQASRWGVEQRCGTCVWFEITDRSR
jgi:anti-sigma regulatory factor (Ser/Thr protein kinase)